MSYNREDTCIICVYCFPLHIQSDALVQNELELSSLKCTSSLKACSLVSLLQWVNYRFGFKCVWQPDKQWLFSGTSHSYSSCPLAKSNQSKERKLIKPGSMGLSTLGIEKLRRRCTERDALLGGKLFHKRTTDSMFISSPELPWILSSLNPISSYI